MSKAMTLIEVLIALAIFIVGFTGILVTYINMFILADIARNATVVNNAAQFEMEKLKKENFDNLSNYNGNIFYVKYTSPDHTGIEITDTLPADASLIMGVGRIDISDITAYSRSNVKEIRITVSFRSQKRVIGGDKNLNGVPDAGDVLDQYGRIDSPVELVTLVTK